MPRTRFNRFLFSFLPLFFAVRCFGANLELRTATTVAQFGPNGLLSVAEIESPVKVEIARDAWSIVVDGTTLRSTDAQPFVRRASESEVTYTYQIQEYQIGVAYELRDGWKVVAKRIKIMHAPNATFTVHRVVPWDLQVQNPVLSDYVPSTYVPQFGASIEKSRGFLPGKDFGEFLRFAKDEGVMLLVQNPYLRTQRNDQSVTVTYEPEMEWQQAWGDFEADTACIGAYHLTNHREPSEMVTEWHLPPGRMPDDGMDDAEVEAYTECVRAFLINPSPSPLSVEVGWTLNDYQIDVRSPEGMAEYKRIIDTASQLGIETLLYAPANSKLSERTSSTDSWRWEYVLWLNLGEKIRQGIWDPAKDAIPESVSEILHYAKEKHVGLLAYVYPSIPFAANPAWIVKGEQKENGPDAGYSYSTLSSRDFQDCLIRNLIAFQKRTGIAGYSFDYTWLDLAGSSSYAQWHGWQRVMKALRQADPSIVMDGRQSYQMYGPWSWLAGSYPHPTGNDEQPESFKPYPDLHFDRVSADRTRYVNYWYRNYQFAPQEIIPGYATHQTERSRNVSVANGDQKNRPQAEMMYTRYRPRDWDYLGYRYSFLSSIATGGWNNVVDMIPARDPGEAEHFAAEDKKWISDWLEWTKKNKEFLRHTRTILDQPAIGHVDGTAAIIGDRGFLFLFNPNYKHLSAEISLDEKIGLSGGELFLLQEVYPQKGRLYGKPGTGAWRRGDRVTLELDGTSATVLELIPFAQSDKPILFNASSLTAELKPGVLLNDGTLVVEHAAGEAGTDQAIGVLLTGNARINHVTVNGISCDFKQTGNFVAIPVRFAGERFSQAQEVALRSNGNETLNGDFVVPQRVMDQLAARRRAWPLNWTAEDYETTWLAPERLLLFVQAAEAKDTTPIAATVDGQVLLLKPAYSSVRVHAASFVGFYADVSTIAPDVRHKIELRIPQMAPGQFQGVFFDNVTPQLTESVAP